MTIMPSCDSHVHFPNGEAETQVTSIKKKTEWRLNSESL